MAQVIRLDDELQYDPPRVASGVEFSDVEAAIKALPPARQAEIMRAIVRDAQIERWNKLTSCVFAVFKRAAEHWRENAFPREDVATVLTKLAELARTITQCKNRNWDIEAAEAATTALAQEIGPLAEELAKETDYTIPQFGDYVPF